ncbi:putative YccA/Bax inhibitor family protein [Actinopolyspora biskrensis]|uniref:Putative YccA/Bax inhibitor family protein n=1 Tax=Actinopolyspora biskrensis TaxID=1470178 RepID=A0A852ZE11_9ACTN|nr:Bax inhibitor-1/YccA family protein [Actinopolyspora biskrensis]NYH80223.1 putative YccA/Bax inhibitor family protein [Actinopolyspora biskrensis]
MRTSSNPAFKSLPKGGHANFNYGQPPGGSFGAGGQAPTAPKQAGRPLTIDDVVTKTATTLAITIGTAAATYFVAGPQAIALALPAALVGFVLALVNIFKKKVSPALVIAYSAVEGVFLGGISYMFASMVNPGIIMQALAGTMGVFAAMLVVYKTGAIRVTPKLTKWIIGAAAGAFTLMLINLVAGFFVEGGLGIRDSDGGPLAIGFSLLCIGIAAFVFLLDFDEADRAIKNGVDAQYSWYIAFSLMVTLIWLYLEILRLLSYLQND